MRGSVAIALILCATPGLAEEDATASARESFERGFDLVQKGDLDGAVAAFEQAYRLRPHYSVLYNLAQAYVASGNVVRAVDSFNRYLELGGEAVPPERRNQVLEAIRYHSRRIGTLELEVTPENALIHVDGLAVGVAPLPRPIRVSSGSHVVSLELAGYAPLVARVDVAGSQTQRLTLTLTPQPAASFDLRCTPRDGALRVDGKAVSLPEAGEPLRLPSGEHRFEYHREGYLPHSVIARAGSGESVAVPCPLFIDPKYPKNAVLRVRHPVATEVRLNGAPFRGGRVPPGPHEVSVGGPGYVPSSVAVELRAGEQRTLTVLPASTDSAREDALARATDLRHTVAYGMSGLGLAAAAVAGALYLSNNEAHDDWRVKNRSLVGRLVTDPESVTPSQLDALLEEENTIRNRDTVAVGLSVFGGVLFVGGLVLRFWPETADSPRLVTTGRASRVSVSF